MTTPYVYEAHAPVSRRGIPWPVCKYCGLVYLKNPLTRWAIKMGCNNEDHPGYRRKLKE